MTMPVDLAGQRFGRWLVLAKHGYVNKVPYFMCRCDCGTEKPVRSPTLQAGTSKSCGCLVTEIKNSRSAKDNSLNQTLMPPGHTGLRFLISSYRASAKKRGHVWGLKDGEVAVITKMNCHYCNCEPTQIAKPSTRISRRTETVRAYENGFYVYNGIDRLCPNKGYVLDNVAPCCMICNYAKNIMNSNEFAKWILKVLPWAQKHTKQV